jgi:hypothetical protein
MPRSENITGEFIDAAIRLHNALGSGVLKSGLNC